jgi:hypothetical protein
MSLSIPLRYTLWLYRRWPILVRVALTLAASASLALVTAALLNTTADAAGRPAADAAPAAGQAPSPTRWATAPHQSTEFPDPIAHAAGPPQSSPHATASGSDAPVTAHPPASTAGFNAGGPTPMSPPASVTSTADPTVSPVSSGSAGPTAAATETAQSTVSSSGPGGDGTTDPGRRRGQSDVPLPGPSGGQAADPPTQASGSNVSSSGDHGDPSAGPATDAPPHNLSSPGPGADGAVNATTTQGTQPSTSAPGPNAHGMSSPVTQSVAGTTPPLPDATRAVCEPDGDDAPGANPLSRETSSWAIVSPSSFLSLWAASHPAAGPGIAWTVHASLGLEPPSGAPPPISISGQPGPAGPSPGTRNPGACCGQSVGSTSPGAVLGWGAWPPGEGSFASMEEPFASHGTYLASRIERPG